MQRYKKFTVSLMAILASWHAHSLEGFVGKISYLEPTYMPTAIRFTLDSGNTACPAGKALRWSKEDVENNKIVYSTMMAAMKAKQPIRVYINDGDSNCTIQYLHLLN